MPFVAAIDIGGTGLRVAVYDHEGTQVALARRRWSARRDPNDPSMVELDADELWAAVVDAAAEAFASRAGEIEAVATTAVRLGCALVSDDETLYVGANNDARGLQEAIAVWKDHHDSLYERSGIQPPVATPGSRLMWFAAHDPGRLEKARALLSLDAWLAWRLTGVAMAEPSAAAASNLLDGAQRHWSDVCCLLMSVDRALLPELVDAGQPVGTTQALGLTPGTPVTLGGGDTHAGTVGLGAVTPGLAGAVAGHTMPLMSVTDRFRTDPMGRCWASPHPVPGRWVVDGNIGHAGEAAEWVANVLGVSIGELGTLSAASEPGAGGASAYLGPLPTDFGDLPLLRRGLLNVSLPLAYADVGRPEIARALVENVAFAFATVAGWVVSIAGEPEELRLGGGLLRLETLAEVIASALGRTVHVADDVEVTLRGAVLAASVAAGWHPTLEAAANALASARHAVEPVWASAYEGRLAQWQEGVASATIMRLRDLAGG